MVKRSKSAKSEEASEIPVGTEENEATNIEENGDAELATKNKGKSAKKEEIVETKEEQKDTDVKENGNEKKKTTTKSKAGTKKPKAVAEPERKSSRQPKPVLKQGDPNEAFEVEKIVDSCVQRGKVLYQVRWKGFSAGDNTWEEESDLKNCTELLQKFKSQKGKGQKRSVSKSPVKTKKARTTKEEKDYEVEDIVDMKVKGGKKEYKIRWKGYKASADTWEPEENLSCKDLIKKYLDSNKEVKNEVEKPKTARKRSKTPIKSKTSKKSRAK